MSSRLNLLPSDSLLTSAMVSDSLDLVGLRRQVLTTGLPPLASGMRCFGRAATGTFVPSERVDPTDPYGAAIGWIDDLQPGDVVVLQTGLSRRSAFWGELFSAAAVGRGAAGLVTDGPVRDSRKILRVGLPVFSPARDPRDFKGRMELTSAGEAVVLGGVQICPGDYILADDDGVVVVPQDVEVEVIQHARRRLTAESTVLEELLEGGSLRSVWDRHRVL